MEKNEFFQGPSQRVVPEKTAQQRLNAFFEAHPELAVDLHTVTEQSSGIKVIRVLQEAGQQLASSHGKGLTEKEAQLSASFEYLERLYHFNAQTEPATNVLTSLIDFYQLQLSTTTQHKILSFFENKQLKAATFENVTLPVSFLRASYGSNGLAAGCTKLEATIYSKLEIYEREHRFNIQSGAELTDELLAQFEAKLPSDCITKLRLFCQKHPGVHIATQVNTSSCVPLYTITLFVPILDGYIAISGVAFDSMYALQRSLTEAVQILFCYSQIAEKSQQFEQTLQQLQLPTFYEDGTDFFTLYVQQSQKSTVYWTKEQFKAQKLTNTLQESILTLLSVSHFPINLAECNTCLDELLHQQCQSNIREIENSGIYIGGSITTSSRLFSLGNIEADFLNWLETEECFVPEILADLNHVTETLQLRYLLNCYENLADEHEKCLKIATQLNENISNILQCVHALLHQETDKVEELFKKCQFQRYLNCEFKRFIQNWTYLLKGLYQPHELLPLTQLYLICSKAFEKMPDNLDIDAIPLVSANDTTF